MVTSHCRAPGSRVMSGHVRHILLGFIAVSAVLANAEESTPWWSLPVTSGVYIRDVAFSLIDPNLGFIWSGILYETFDAGDTWHVVPARLPMEEGPGTGQSPLLDLLGPVASTESFRLLPVMARL